MAFISSVQEAKILRAKTAGDTEMHTFKIQPQQRMLTSKTPAKCHMNISKDQSNLLP